ncbi:SHOCT-like domain-containing protein [Clostridium magnum]|uniref:YvlB/LiaX N-terminal domain-containing protein n=1 Tax=Clostridium magnum DSM 2767 TaxID=1121326 RepID=A0A162RQ10_9CLOT|nr:hypothetical protein [Clostridium magnum]KZL90221.1 hypothetical protein CLMAG_39920 [Clostridium magnum DSM 2767]SHI14112.1 hypothetical protein SAMN02745944_02699 [Clostridium magnum DSM 2767]
MNDEIMKVLKMLEEGKIDAQKAGELIEVLYASKNNVPAVINSDKMLKIRVNSQNGDNVNINIPVKFIRTIGGAIKRIPKVEGVEGMEDIDIQAILQAVSDGLDGKIVDVKSEKGDNVEIVVE